MTERLANRTSGVPRGLLRFLVLTMLAKKPMSGVEIVETIDKETGGDGYPAQVQSIRFWLGCMTKVSPTRCPAKKWELNDTRLQLKEKRFLKNK